MLENQGLLYDAEYYRRHCGPVPYGRTQPWLEFFAHIADTLMRTLKPRRVFDAGCAWGLLVEAFRDRGVEAWGADLSSYAISNVRPDIQPYCRLASLTEPTEDFYDLITCIEVLEHMPEHDADQAIRNLCRATDAILFSSTPSDLSEPTHVNVRPLLYWLRRFSRQGFAPDPVYDASFVSPHAFLLRRRYGRLPEEAIELFVEKLRIQSELAARSRELGEIYASPGWRLIRRYRAWLRSIRERRPWLLKLVEPMAAWLLQNGDASLSPDEESPAPRPPLEVPTDEILPTPAHPRPLPSASGFSYADWILEQEPDEAALAVQRKLAASFSYRPRISVIVPVYRIPFAILNQTIASVVGQTYPNWELCLAHADPSATSTRQYLASLAEADQRIKVSLLDENRGISANSNRALALATGDFIALLDHDDTLAPFALFEVVQVLNEQPSTDFLYSDRDEIKQVGDTIQRVNPLLKPQWSPDILLSANYLTHFSVIAAEHVRAIGGWREETDGAQDWDLFLRAIHRGRNVCHIPKILYHWRQVETSVAGAGLAAKPYAEGAQLRTVREHCRRQGWNADVIFDVHRRLRILWMPRPEQTISVIFVSADADAEALSHAGRLRAGGAYSPAEIVLPLASDLVPEDPRIRVVRVAAEASLAEKLCRAVEHSTGEILVFVDQAVSPADENWLGELAGPLQNKEIGLVGAKLLAPDNVTVRHAGIVFTEGNRMEYVFAGGPEDIDAEFGSPTWYRNWSAVSGACFSLRREVWAAVGGFSGVLQYPRLDVDLCLRVRSQAGLRVVYNPFARFFQSNPAAMEGWLWNVSQEAADRFLRERFPGGDPYFHSKLTCREGTVRLRSRAGLAAGASAWQ